MVDTWRTHGGQGLEARPKRTHDAHMVDTWWTQGGHMGDKPGGTQPEPIAASFFLRESPAVNYLGNDLLN